MNFEKISRRKALTSTALAMGAALTPSGLAAAEGSAVGASAPGAVPFRFSLNMATIRGHKLGIVKEIEVAAAAGYDGIEPWVDSIQEYTRSGGSLEDLKKRIADAGLTVEGAIGFPEWIVDDETRRNQGMERAKREMDLVARIGGKRFAAPPAGATDLPKLDLVKAAERYRALLEVGDELGIVPELEVWGFSKNMSRLGECVGVAIETGHPKACVLPDVFHLHKGGSDFHGLALLGPRMAQVLHMNDFPMNIPREQINDGARVFPGEGGAPLAEILTAFASSGGPKVLSVEVFNRDYYQQEALSVAKNGLSKMKHAAASIRR
jgi:2-keto-myo-inositol isomerase